VKIFADNNVVSHKSDPHPKVILTSWNNGSGLKKQQQLMMGEESKSEKVPKKPTKHCLRNSFYRETLNVLSPISDY